VTAFFVGIHARFAREVAALPQAWRWWCSAAAIPRPTTGTSRDPSDDRGRAGRGGGRSGPLPGNPPTRCPGPDQGPAARPVAAVWWSGGGAASPSPSTRPSGLVERQFPRPDPAQEAAWPLIAAGGTCWWPPRPHRQDLTASWWPSTPPTGRRRSGGGRAGASRGAPPGPRGGLRVPLRALATDVHENLQVPLAGIRAAAAELGLAAPELRWGSAPGHPGSRTGGHAPVPPDLLVTTPESLYLCPPPPRPRPPGRRAHGHRRRGAHLARDKRGSIWPEPGAPDRVVGGVGGHLQRIGLSATSVPRVVARCSGGRPRPAAPVVVDCGHRRDIDVAIELPDAELEAVAPHGQFAECWTGSPTTSGSTGPPWSRQHPQDGRTGGPSAG